MSINRCEGCGTIYDPAKGDPSGGVRPGTPWLNLPRNWVCPSCGLGPESFSPVEPNYLDLKKETEDL